MFGSSSPDNEIKRSIKNINMEIKALLEKIKVISEKIRTTPLLTEDQYNKLMTEIEPLKEKLRELKYVFKKTQKELWRETKELNKIKSFYYKNHDLAKNNISDKLDKVGITEAELQQLNDALEKTKEKLKDATAGYVSLLKRIQVMKKSSRKKKVATISFSDEFNFGEVMAKYIGSIIGSTIKGIEETLKTAIPSDLVKWKLDPTKLELDTEEIEEIIEVDEDALPEFLEKASLLFSALGDKSRLKILKILEKGPEFQKELSEKTGLKGGTFKHHTDLLKEANLITREAVRGRYLITRLGFEAIKLAELMYHRYIEYLKEKDDEEDEE